MLKVAIVDYGMGNLHSVYLKLSQLGLQPVVAQTPQAMQLCDKIILPGVGHFGKAMQNLRERGLAEALQEAVLVRKKPVLGICLGMQLMANFSEEGNAAGLGWFDAGVEKFRIKDPLKHKVPQTGWNTIAARKESNLLRNLPNQSEFYFLHAYHFTFKENQDTSILATTHFEYEYASAVEKDHIFGTQFHPEKSHEAGRQLLQNFIQL